MSFLRKFGIGGNAEVGVDQCMEYHAEGMPNEVQLLLHDSTVVESVSSNEGSLTMSFKNGGLFFVNNDPASNQIGFILENPGTSAYVKYRGEVVMSLPNGKGEQKIRTDKSSQGDVKIEQTQTGAPITQSVVLSHNNGITIKQSKS